MTPRVEGKGPTVGSTMSTSLDLSRNAFDNRTLNGSEDPKLFLTHLDTQRHA